MKVQGSLIEINPPSLKNKMEPNAIRPHLEGLAQLPEGAIENVKIITKEDMYPSRPLCKSPKST